MIFLAYDNCGGVDEDCGGVDDDCDGVDDDGCYDDYECDDYEA